ncbi:MAG: hypothetical protein JWN26_419 [Candidatus Saccharibacteria bacterium]|nr:hypothetical protein [Candidatus Saccharibacteria bacterium]
MTTVEQRLAEYRRLANVLNVAKLPIWLFSSVGRAEA